MADFFHDPLGQTTFHDVPAPFIVINFAMIDFTRENGATRFVPATQRCRHAPPSLEDEPEWMQNSILCAPAGTAIIRDVRCWHAGTANTSDQIRPMTSVGYYAPWFAARYEGVLPRERYNELSPRAQRLCRSIVAEA
jgi:ectoine hydroxylase-related dioxygenase (phytanoyl-CoA dioxygenase family)